MQHTEPFLVNKKKCNQNTLFEGELANGHQWVINSIVNTFLVVALSPVWTLLLVGFQTFKSLDSVSMILKKAWPLLLTFIGAVAVSSEVKAVTLSTTFKVYPGTTITTPPYPPGSVPPDVTSISVGKSHASFSTFVKWKSHRLYNSCQAQLLTQWNVLLSAKVKRKALVSALKLGK